MECKRKLELAAAELSAWEEDFDKSSLTECRYVETKPPIVPEKSTTTPSRYAYRPVSSDTEVAKEKCEAEPIIKGKIFIKALQMQHLKTQDLFVNKFHKKPELFQPRVRFNDSISDNFLSNSYTSSREAQQNETPFTNNQQTAYGGNLPVSTNHLSELEWCIFPQSPNYGYLPTPPQGVLLNYDTFLPKPEFPKFNGNPLNYLTFINNFEKYIVPKVLDQKMLFCCLLQLCERPVTDQIQHFSNKGDSGYIMARERLQQEYGRPGIIADACEQQLKCAQYVKRQ